MIIHKPPNHNNVMLHHVVEIQINLIFLHLPLLHILCLRTNMQPFKNAQKTLQNGWKQSLSLHLQFSGCFFSNFLVHPYYSKSQFIVQKFNLDKTPTFPQVFSQFFFWQFFSRNQSCQQLKSPKPQHFHEFFTQNKRTTFLGKSKLNFWIKRKISNSL